MDTDQLIRTLAADNVPRARPVGLVLMLALLAAAPVVLLMFFAELGVRPDAMTAIHNPFFDLKFAVTLALAISACAVSLHLSRPEASLRGLGWCLLIPAGMLVAAIGSEMMMPQRLPMMTRLVGHNSRVCMTAIPALSLPILAGALIGLRHGAPARPAVAGAVAGLMSAGLA
ncbi:NrsF family protein, partial [Bradyrhizobium sp.]|uniref:NrsF family protein n=1 Tax=Bradyrhizobium sp. TaxID=376 RepID=UPI003C785B68